METPDAIVLAVFGRWLSENQCGMETTYSQISQRGTRHVEREPMWDGNIVCAGNYLGVSDVEREPMWDGNDCQPR